MLHTAGKAARSRKLWVVGRALVLCATVVMCVVGASRASASSWSVQPAPPPTLPSGQLSALSCASQKACTAVGSSVNSVGGTVGLAERWNGRAWSVQPTPNPNGGFSAVSCPSRNACMAVGGDVVERWNGRTWSIRRAGLSGAALNGVSCWSPRGCVVVGQTFNTDAQGGAAFTARWQRNKWSVQSLPSVGAFGDSLSGVSCTSAAVCMAVGSSVVDSSGDTATLAERWNGRGWSVQGSLDASMFDQLTAVSCASATICTAVGSVSGLSGFDRPLVERWNAGRWSFELTARPAGATGGALVAVSCASPRACTAGGSFTSHAGTTLGLLERWGGAKWSIQSPHRPAPATVGALSAVSCPSAAACTMIGSGQNGAEILAVRRNGRSWSSRTVPDPLGPVPSVLNGVSCASATACVAVGYLTATANGPPTPLAEAWNGNRWTPEIPPSPAGAAGGQLNAVSCASASKCTAVGSFSTTAGGSPIELIEVWSAGSWQVQAAPQPSDSALAGVSCGSLTACVAVGSSANHTLAEVWNGSSWTIESPPDPSGAGSSQLNSVSCSSATVCTAVGYVGELNGGFDSTLAEAWNGSSWTTQNTPNASQTQGNGVNIVNDQLNGVSCVSPTACTAVGTNSDRTLAERWDGSSWTVQPTPNASLVSASVLNAVACASSATCTAIGFARTEPNGGEVDHALAEAWSGGTWTTESTPDPTGKKLNQVSCASAVVCTAAGSTTTSAGVHLPLVERFS